MGAAAHASAIARLEVRLALAELKEKLAEAGVGAGLLAGAALVAFFAIAFALATVAAGISTAIPVWAALLIMTGFLSAVTAVLLALGTRAVRRGMPPAPEQAIQEAKLTAQALTRNGDQSAH
jgi:membrane protein implicated in regulation of membrane protease activity